MVGMAPGAPDPLTKKLICLAVSATSGRSCCIPSHAAAACGKGMTLAQHGELAAMIAHARQTNPLATALRVPVDAAFDRAPPDRCPAVPQICAEKAVERDRLGLSVSSGFPVTR